MTIILSASHASIALLSLHCLFFVGSHRLNLAASNYPSAAPYLAYSEIGLLMHHRLVSYYTFIEAGTLNTFFFSAFFSYPFLLPGFFTAPKEF